MNVVTDPQTNRNNLWNPAGIQRVVAEHMSGHRNCIREIHFILALEAIDRLLVRAPAALRANPNYSVPATL
jgi:asparagine synthase (glutamine-hydrolysing)